MKTFNEYIQEMPRKYNDSIACQYIENGQVIKINYLQFTEDINRVSRYLIAHNMQGEKIGILGGNSYRWLVCYMAVVNINGIVILMNQESSSEEACELMKMVDTQILICEEKWKKNFENVVLFTMEQIFKESSSFSGKILICKASAERLSNICFTSGTTGKQKGVMLSQKCLLSNCYLKECAGVDVKERCLLTMPIYHMMGLAAAIQILTGTMICLNFSGKYFYRDLKTFQPHIMSVVPLMLEVMGKELRKNDFNCEILGGSLKTLYCGGAKMDSKTTESFKKAGIQVVQGYGMTELTGVALNTLDSEKPDSVGKVFPWVQVKNVEGEIVVKSEYVMLGYYNNEEETNKILKEGWLHTGDLGYVDEDGFLYVTGRKKNLIILSNGENVSPEELEEKLKNCSLIYEVQVYEEKNKICAEIYTESNEKIHQQIQEYVMELNVSMPVYKQIHKVKYRETEFEKSESGKIKRKYLQ